MMSSRFSRFAVLVAAGWVAGACGSESESTIFEFQWQFDYSNPSSSERDLRACDNGRNLEVTYVSVEFSRVDGPGGFEALYPCAEGDGTLATEVPFERGVYDIVAEAGQGGDKVTYRGRKRGVFLEPENPYMLTLSTVVGEMVIRPDISGVADCGADVGVIITRLHAVVDGVAESEPTRSYTFESPCDGRSVAALELLDVPAADEEGNGSRRYEVRSEARDLDAQLVGCDRFERDVAPGPAVGSQTTLLSLGACE